MKKKKYNFIIWPIVTIFIVIMALFLIFQTPPAKNKIKSLIIETAKKNNIALSFDKINGFLPFEYHLKNVSLQIDDKKIEIENISFRIHFLALLKKELSFSLFEADNILINEISTKNQNKNLQKPKQAIEDQKNQKQCLLKTTISITDQSNKDKSMQKKSSKITKIDWPSFSFSLNFDRLILKNLHFKYKETNLNLDIFGKAKYFKFGKKITGNLKIKRKDFEKSYLDIAFSAYKENTLLEAKTTLKVQDAKAIDFIYQDDFDFAFDLYLVIDANINSLFTFNKNFFAKAKGNIYKIQNTQTKKSLFLLDPPLDFSFDLLSRDNFFQISKGFLKNDLFNAYFDAILKNDFTFNDFAFEKGNIIFRIDELNKINKKFLGSFLTKVTIENKKFISDFNFKDLKIALSPPIDTQGVINGTFTDNTLIGNVKSEGFFLNQAFNIFSDIKYENSEMIFSKLQLKTPSTNLFANLKVLNNFQIIGDGKIHFEDFSQLQVLMPKLKLDSTLDANFTFYQKEIQADNFSQNLNLDIFLQDYHFKNLYGKNLDINLQIDNLFKEPIFDYNLNFKDVFYHDLHVKNVEFSSSTAEENWPYELKMVASIKKPIEINSKGFFKVKNKNEFFVDIQDFYGFLLTHNYITQKPISLEKTKNAFKLKDFEIILPNSSISGDLNFTKASSLAKVVLKNFPVDFLSTNPLDLDITGFVNATLNLKDNIGNLNIDLKDFNILALGDVKPLIANGTLNSTFQNDYYNLDTSLKIKNSQFFEMKGKIPLDLDLYKLKMKFNEDKNLSLDINYKGKIEELLDFVNIGPQRLEGDIISEIHLSNTLLDLKTDGFLNFEKGYFENYYTGTILKDIQAKIIAKDDKINLEKLSGFDPEKGSFFIDGIFSLSKEKNFAFFFNTKIDDLLCVDSDMIKAYVSSELQVSGDAFSSIAKGEAIFNNLEMTIPDTLPIVIPDLKPKFTSYPSEDSTQLKAKIYPIHLDINLDATKPVRINGQGLTSTWRGNFKLKGTYNQLETYGTLELIKGFYVFASRRLDLLKGEVFFNGEINALPSLDIDAKMRQSNIDILAHIKGDLDSPKISFSSTPPLPASSIMSLLIFGKELSELNDFQTVELATTLSQKTDDAKIAPSKAPTNLGIDRFNIVSPSSTDSTNDQMAIQFGKYITKGVVVSLSQGSEQGSSNIIVEVDLKKGFIFQAESQQQEEQGKFSLKWRRNY